MPSEPQSSDIVPITVISLVLAFLATLYPSWRASRVNPAEAFAMNELLLRNPFKRWRPKWLQKRHRAEGPWQAKA
jgi:hypothetical protein